MSGVSAGRYRITGSANDGVHGRFDARLLPGQRVRLCLHADRCYPDYVRQVDASAIRVGTSPFTVNFPGRRD
ncbi:hypothetical protein AB0B74_07750 [Micromonospora parva]|uniref:hypothetical protein n=1 Tax=Micromonospora parva TaxID=1464048 RepID=UPI0033D26AC9